MISQLKGKKQVVFCDIDNSFYDIESAMYSRFPDYPINSESYDLEDKFLLEFYNPKTRGISWCSILTLLALRFISES